MTQQTGQSVEANFSKGLVTEYTAITFPENAVQDTSNCIFNRIGNVTRRPAFDYEDNAIAATIDRSNAAVVSYKWNNAGGDGSTQIVVEQIGYHLHFYLSSAATVASPLSANKLVTVIDLTTLPHNKISDIIQVTECQFTEGNGYLFVFHSDVYPFYCSYAAGVVTTNVIDTKMRDFSGILETGVKDQDRPSVLSPEHQYNLLNQGWTSAAAWSSMSTSSVAITLGTGHTFTIASGLSISNGDVIQVNGVGADLRGGTVSLNGSVTSYSGTTLVLNITSLTNTFGPLLTTYNNWTLYPFNAGLIDHWHTDEGNYPSNADIWWRFKDSTGVFDPATTQPDVTLNAGPAPKGYFIIDPFNIDRTAISAVAGLTVTSTLFRPKVGTWFAGRLWMTGVDDSQAATGDAPYYTWTENIYFSQTAIDASQFGKCYQTNDPTSEDFFDLLPTDGGVINIQGSGSIYKLFPCQNGLLVFAANGIWFITGSNGIGFAANDYTITKLSSIQAISGSSFVDVQGYPMWWNAEGIYTVVGDGKGTSYGPTRGALGNGGLTTQPLTYTTIQSFYDQIPLDSKKYAKGVFDPLSWEVKWIYRSTQDADITNRYQYDSVLVLNTVTQAFSPWTISKTTDTPVISGIVYVQSPGGSTAPEPMIKYLVSTSTIFTYANEFDAEYVDWVNAQSPVNFSSYFISGFKLIGGGLHKFQPNYINIFINNVVNVSYTIQGIWDFALNRSSGKFTSTQLVQTLDSPEYFGVLWRRHKIRGRGIVLQFKITSVDGAPFDILGWSVEEKVNQGT